VTDLRLRLIWHRWAWWCEHTAAVGEQHSDSRYTRASSFFAVSSHESLSINGPNQSLVTLTGEGTPVFDLRSPVDWPATGRDQRLARWEAISWKTRHTAWLADSECNRPHLHPLLYWSISTAWPLCASLTVTRPVAAAAAVVPPTWLDNFTAARSSGLNALPRRSTVAGDTFQRRTTDDL